MVVVDPQDLVERVRALSPVPLELLAGAWAVGGAVRDLLLGRKPRELDLVVQGDAVALARRVRDAAGGDLVVHDRFGTATLGTLDVARAREERYPRPGALPEVAPAGIEADLARRDFAVNAIALRLPDGELLAAPHALEDLDARLLRVLHDRSFVDDPTRALRLGRYAARLGFAPESRTRELAAATRLGTVSAARIGNEVRLALREPDPVQVLRWWDELGVLPPGLRVPDAGEVARALALLPDDGRPELVVLGAALDGDPDLGLPARELAVAARVAEARGSGGGGAAPDAPHPRGFAPDDPVEAVAMAGARGDADAEDWLRRGRHVRLAITGDDLIAAGVPRGPEVGRRLAAALAAKRAGEVEGREAELRAALEADVG